MDSKQKIVALVPMKLNNRRLPGKNIMRFDNGEPLCHYVLTTLLSIKEIDEVYVYCSSETIKEYIPAGVKYLKRSVELDKDTTKINEVIAAFANEIEADIYVMSHVTSPFIEAASIRNGLAAVLGGAYDSALAVQQLATFLWKDGKPLNYQLDNIPRTQDLPPVYAETSGFYIFKSDVIKQLHRRIGEKPFLVQVSQTEAVDVDEKEDFLIANAIYNQRLKQVNKKCDE